MLPYTLKYGQQAEKGCLALFHIWDGDQCFNEEFRSALLDHTHSLLIIMLERAEGVCGVKSTSFGLICSSQSQVMISLVVAVR